MQMVDFNRYTALPDIKNLILEIPVLTSIQKKFYLAIMEERYEKVFQPACRKIMGRQKEEESKLDFTGERRCR